ncbi:MAG TPA: hypothetical protein VK479_09765 [Micropepsaceae bacterium]|nr:hypothetical protein [Micropepsaceae bacterium]
MVIGHYAVAMAAKRVAPRTSLGTLIAAAIFLDLLWPVLVLLGIETVAVTPGATAVNPLTFVSYPYSHSLLMSTVWGLLFAGGYFVARRYVPGAITLGVLVVSHWVLDAVVHVPDLPLAPWGATRIGLGLWNSLSLTLSVELALFAFGLAIYIGTTNRRDSTGTWGLGLMTALMLLIYVGAIFGPPPPSASLVAWSAMGQWLVVALGAWVDRHRRAF